MAKVEIVETPKEKVFEPITFQITIESAEEFREMWHRMNLSIETVEEVSTEGCDNFKPVDFSVLSGLIWLKLDKINNDNPDMGLIYK